MAGQSARIAQRGGTGGHSGRRGNRIEPADLPDNLSPARPPANGRAVEAGARVSLEELENEHLRRVLAGTASLEEAAQILGIDPATLYRKRKKLGL